LESIARIVSLSSRYAKCTVIGLVVVQLLSGCVANLPAPITDRTDRSLSSPRPNDANEVVSADRGDEPRKPTQPAAIVVPKSPARDLLALADRHLAAGDHGSAAAVIDRALQIAPGDALSWHKLAQLHFAEGQYAQAKSVALRSNALPSVKPSLKRSNWSLIESIERAMGNSAAGDAAAKRANE
jgi:tetratricopeptide (TPR) repeat protein